MFSQQVQTLIETLMLQYSSTFPARGMMSSTSETLIVTETLP